MRQELTPIALQNLVVTLFSFYFAYCYWGNLVGVQESFSTEAIPGIVVMSSSAVGWAQSRVNVKM